MMDTMTPEQLREEFAELTEGISELEGVLRDCSQIHAENRQNRREALKLLCEMKDRRYRALEALQELGEA